MERGKLVVELLPGAARNDAFLTRIEESVKALPYALYRQGAAPPGRLALLWKLSLPGKLKEQSEARWVGKGRDKYCVVEAELIESASERDQEAERLSKLGGERWKAPRLSPEMRWQGLPKFENSPKGALIAQQFQTAVEDNLYFTGSQVSGYKPDQPWTWKRQVFGPPAPLAYISPYKCIEDSGECQVTLSVDGGLGASILTRQGASQEARQGVSQRESQTPLSFQEISRFVITVFPPPSPQIGFQLRHGNLSALVGRRLVFLSRRRPSLLQRPQPQLGGKQESFMETEEEAEEKEIQIHPSQLEKPTFDEEEFEPQSKSFTAWLEEIAERKVAMTSELDSLSRVHDEQVKARERERESGRRFADELRGIEDKYQAGSSKARKPKPKPSSSSSSSRPYSSSSSSSVVRFSPGSSPAMSSEAESGRSRELERLRRERDEAIARCIPTAQQEQQKMVIEEMRRKIDELSLKIEGYRKQELKEREERARAQSLGKVEYGQEDFGSRGGQLGRDRSRDVDADLPVEGIERRLRTRELRERGMEFGTERDRGEKEHKYMGPEDEIGYKARSSERDVEEELRHQGSNEVLVRWNSLSRQSLQPLFDTALPQQSLRTSIFLPQI